VPRPSLLFFCPDSSSAARSTPTATRGPREPARYRAPPTCPLHRQPHDRPRGGGRAPTRGPAPEGRRPASGGRRRPGARPYGCRSTAGRSGRQCPRAPPWIAATESWQRAWSRRLGWAGAAGNATLPDMAAGDVELLRRGWEAFARGDVEAATDVLHPQVRWYGAGAEAPDDGCHSRDEALAFIRQALADGVTAEAFDFRDAGDRVVVLVQTRPRRPRSPLCHRRETGRPGRAHRGADGRCRAPDAVRIAPSRDGGDTGGGAISPLWVIGPT